MLSGKAFDKKEVYTEEQAKNLNQDINNQWTRTMGENPVKGNLAIITAGSPGCGKSMLMRQIRNEYKSAGQVIAWSDPDDKSLREEMPLTFGASIAACDGSEEAREAAYNEWRPGSNAAAHLVLANLIREKFSFFFGTTSTGDQTWRLYDLVKKQGYNIHLLHVTAQDKVRWDSIEKRNETFIQVKKSDIQSKNELFPQRINDTYLKYADKIDFYFRDVVEQDAKLSATWIRNQDESAVKKGILTIHNKVEYEKIKAIHNVTIAALNKPELKWEDAVESISEIK
jgi:hypothetical protein